MIYSISSIVTFSYLKANVHLSQDTFKTEFVICKIYKDAEILNKTSHGQNCRNLQELHGDMRGKTGLKLS